MSSSEAAFVASALALADSTLALAARLPDLLLVRAAGQLLAVALAVSPNPAAALIARQDRCVATLRRTAAELSATARRGTTSSVSTSTSLPSFCSATLTLASLVRGLGAMTMRTALSEALPPLLHVLDAVQEVGPENLRYHAVFVWATHTLAVITSHAGPLLGGQSGRCLSRGLDLCLFGTWADAPAGAVLAGRLANELTAAKGPEYVPGSAAFSACQATLECLTTRETRLALPWSGLSVGAALRGGEGGNGGGLGLRGGRSPLVVLAMQETVLYIGKLALFAPAALRLIPATHALTDALSARRSGMRLAAARTMRHLIESQLRHTLSDGAGSGDNDDVPSPSRIAVRHLERHLVAALGQEQDAEVRDAVVVALDALASMSTSADLARWLDLLGSLVLPSGSVGTDRGSEGPGAPVDESALGGQAEKDSGNDHDNEEEELDEEEEGDEEGRDDADDDDVGVRPSDMTVGQGGSGAHLRPRVPTGVVLLVARTVAAEMLVRLVARLAATKEGDRSPHHRQEQQDISEVHDDDDSDNDTNLDDDVVDEDEVAGRGTEGTSVTNPSNPRILRMAREVGVLIRLGYLTATGSLDLLRPYGIRLLSAVVMTWGGSPDPDMPGGKLLDQYVAQLVSAVRMSVRGLPGCGDDDDLGAAGCVPGGGLLNDILGRGECDKETERDGLDGEKREISTPTDSCSTIPPHPTTTTAFGPPPAQTSSPTRVKTNPNPTAAFIVPSMGAYLALSMLQIGILSSDTVAATRLVRDLLTPVPIWESALSAPNHAEWVTQQLQSVWLRTTGTVACLAHWPNKEHKHKYKDNDDDDRDDVHDDRSTRVLSSPVDQVPEMTLDRDGVWALLEPHRVQLVVRWRRFLDDLVDKVGAIALSLPSTHAHGSVVGPIVVIEDMDLWRCQWVAVPDVVRSLAAAEVSSLSSLSSSAPMSSSLVSCCWTLLGALAKDDVLSQVGLDCTNDDVKTNHDEKSGTRTGTGTKKWNGLVSSSSKSYPLSSWTSTSIRVNVLRSLSKPLPSTPVHVNPTFPSTFPSSAHVSARLVDHVRLGLLEAIEILRANDIHQEEGTVSTAETGVKHYSSLSSARHVARLLVEGSLDRLEGEIESREASAPDGDRPYLEEGMRVTRSAASTLAQMAPISTSLSNQPPEENHLIIADRAARLAQIAAQHGRYDATMHTASVAATLLGPLASIGTVPSARRDDDVGGRAFTALAGALSFLLHGSPEHAGTSSSLSSPPRMAAIRSVGRDIRQVLQAWQRGVPGDTTETGSATELRPWIIVLQDVLLLHRKEHDVPSTWARFTGSVALDLARSWSVLDASFTRTRRVLMTYLASSWAAKDGSSRTIRGTSSLPAVVSVLSDIIHTIQAEHRDPDSASAQTCRTIPLLLTPRLRAHVIFCAVRAARRELDVQLADPTRAAYRHRPDLFRASCARTLHLCAVIAWALAVPSSTLPDEDIGEEGEVEGMVGDVKVEGDGTGEGEGEVEAALQVFLQAALVAGRVRVQLQVVPGGPSRAALLGGALSVSGYAVDLIIAGTAGVLRPAILALPVHSKAALQEALRARAAGNFIPPPGAEPVARPDAGTPPTISVHRTKATANLVGVPDVRTTGNAEGSPEHLKVSTIGGGGGNGGFRLAPPPVAAGWGNLHLGLRPPPPAAAAAAAAFPVTVSRPLTAPVGGLKEDEDEDEDEFGAFGDFGNSGDFGDFADDESREDLGEASPGKEMEMEVIRGAHPHVDAEMDEAFGVLTEVTEKDNDRLWNETGENEGEDYESEASGAWAEGEGAFATFKEERMDVHAKAPGGEKVDEAEWVVEEGEGEKDAAAEQHEQARQEKEQGDPVSLSLPSNEEEGPAISHVEHREDVTDVAVEVEWDEVEGEGPGQILPDVAIKEVERETETETSLHVVEMPPTVGHLMGDVAPDRVPGLQEGEAEAEAGSACKSVEVADDMGTDVDMDGTEVPWDYEPDRTVVEFEMTPMTTAEGLPVESYPSDREVVVEVVPVESHPSDPEVEEVLPVAPSPIPNTWAAAPPGGDDRVGEGEGDEDDLLCGMGVPTNHRTAAMTESVPLPFAGGHEEESDFFAPLGSMASTDAPSTTLNTVLPELHFDDDLESRRTDRTVDGGTDGLRRDMDMDMDGFFSGAGATSHHQGDGGTRPAADTLIQFD